jgi:hypothetical protein
MIVKANLSDWQTEGIFVPDLQLRQKLLHWRLSMQAWDMEWVNGYTIGTSLIWLNKIAKVTCSWAMETGYVSWPCPRLGI